MNTAGTYVIIALLFAAIFGGMSLIGQEALKYNDNVDSDSIAEITNLDKDLNTVYEINTSSGNITAFKVESTSESFEGVDAFEKDLSISRSESANTFTTIASVKNIPESVVGAIPFVNFNDWRFYLSLFGIFFTSYLFFAAFKFWKQGRGDNS